MTDQTPGSALRCATSLAAAARKPSLPLCSTNTSSAPQAVQTVTAPSLGCATASGSAEGDVKDASQESAAIEASAAHRLMIITAEGHVEWFAHGAASRGDLVAGGICFPQKGGQHLLEFFCLDVRHRLFHRLELGHSRLDVKHFTGAQAAPRIQHLAGEPLVELGLHHRRALFVGELLGRVDDGNDAMPLLTKDLRDVNHNILAFTGLCS